MIRRTNDSVYRPLDGPPVEASGDTLDSLSAALARLSSRRGFLAGALRGAIGLGIALAYLGAGRSVFAAGKVGERGCSPLGSGTGTATAKSCGPPATGYASKDNCHYTSDNTPPAHSDKYGCRPLAGHFPYCEDLTPAKTCGNTDPAVNTDLPTCPTGMKNSGYWTCCCSGNNDGGFGLIYTICMDCTDDAATNPVQCTCKKVAPSPHSDAFCE